MDAYRLTIAEASRLIKRGVLTPAELVESVLRRIERLEPSLEAWVTLDREGAIEAATALTEEAEEGQFRGPLHGIPVGVKDIFYTAGMRTAMGSPVYSGFVPSHDSYAVFRLREAGAVILGKTETTEFASRDPAPTCNPWNLEYTPGGSSSGSAAAVSSGMCHAALGTQTGGSVIRPAAFCGVIGLKPTYGLVSTRGVYPLSWSLDHVGVLTRTVEDAAMVLNALAGGVPPTVAALETPPRIGLLRGYFHENADREVRCGMEKALEVLVGEGAEVEEARLPQSFAAVHAAHRVIVASEAASAHEELFKSRMRDYRANIRGLIASGILTPATAYLRALRIRGSFLREMLAISRGFDCLLTPSTITPPLRGLGDTGDPAFNLPFSLCGFPSITVPSGLTSLGLPLGIQLVGCPLGESRLLGAASWCHGVLGFGSDPHDPDVLSQ